MSSIGLRPAAHALHWPRLVRWRRLEEHVGAWEARPWLVLAVVLAAMALQVKGSWIAGEDALAYMSISRNLSLGKLECLGSPHVMYAPGYPLLIAPVWWISDSPFWIISLVHLGLAGGLAAGVYQWMRRIHPGSAVLLTALVMVNTSLWHAFRVTQSELAFMTELIWCTLCLQQATESDSWRRTLAFTVPGIVLAVLLAYTRQAGTLLVAGFAVSLLIRVLRRQERWLRAATLAIAVGAPVFACVLALILWDRHRSTLAGPEYKPTYTYLVDEAATPLQQLTEGARMRISECGRLLIPGMFKCYGRRGEWLNVNVLIYVALLPVLILGWWRLVRRVSDPLLLMAPFYMALYMAWTWDQGTRYLLPMLPVLWATAAEAFLKNRKLILAGLIAAHLGVSVGYWIHSLPDCHVPVVGESPIYLTANPTGR